MKNQIIITLIFITALLSAQAQKNHTDANIVGHVVCCGEHIPYVTISIVGTTIGTTTDETGHYRMINLPIGELTMRAQSVGYKTVEKIITTKKDLTISVKFELEEDVQEFNETAYLRTPNYYGYFAADWNISKAWYVSSTFNYTGSMLIPYFGEKAPNPELGELIKTGSFYDLGLKIQYTTKINGASMQIFSGVKNIFNSYQNDFDEGINRDPGYIYGPINPRTIYFGVKIGNVLQ